MPPPNRPHLTFYDDVVVKTGPPGTLVTEAAKTRSAHAIAATSNLFVVPNVVEFDDVQGRLVLERIPEVSLRRLANTVAFGRRRLALVDRIATVLARVHQELTIEPQHLITLETNIAWPNESVVVHGDVSLHNVSLLESGELVLFDWQMTKLHGGRATFGTYFFDVSWFILNLFLLRKQGLRYSISQPTTRLAQQFAMSYFRESGRSRDGFDEYLHRLFSHTIGTIRKNSIGRQKFYLECIAPFASRFARQSAMAP